MSESKQENNEKSWFARFLPRNQSRSVFLFAMLCYSGTLTEISARLITFFGLWAVTEDPSSNELRYVRPGFDGSTLVDVLVLGPVIESFALVGAIEILRRLRFPISLQLVISVFLLCLIHWAEYPFWGLLVAPAFFIHAGTYMYWRQVSFWVGVQMVIALHFLTNCLPAITLIREHFER